MFFIPQAYAQATESAQLVAFDTPTISSISDTIYVFSYFLFFTLFVAGFFIGSYVFRR